MVALTLDKLPKKGEVHTYIHRGVRFEMKVVDARIRYGKIDVALTPVNGSGAFWVRYDNLLKNSETETSTDVQFNEDEAVAKLQAAMGE